MTGLIRVTRESDGEILNRGYSYWSQSVVLDGSLYAFVGTGEGYPHLYRIDGSQVTLLGPLPYGGTGEGLYWDRQGWIYHPEGSRLHRTDPFSGDDQIVCDLASAYPSCRLWQTHSSDDGRVHCGTVQRITESGPYENIATVLVLPDRQIYFPAQQDLDESQITPDGAYLVIKEGDDNRIITTATGEERVIRDVEGAVGHSDVGIDRLVGEDNIHGACVRWDLPTRTKRDLFGTWNLGHLAIRGARCVRSSARDLSLIDLDTGAETPLLSHGFDGADYDHQCFANLSPCGTVVAFVGQVEAPRNDLYLLRL